MSFDPLTAGFDLGSKLVGLLTKWIPDTAQRDEAAAEIAGQFNQLIAGQIELNKVEATSQSMFVAGWRPAVGWVCVSAYAYNFVLQPMLTFVLLAVGITLPPLPILDWSELGLVLFGMLGLGGMRTFEKYKGVSK